MNLPAHDSSPRRFSPLKLALLAALVATLAFALSQYRDQLSLDSLARREAEFLTYRDDHPVAVYGLAFLAYVSVAGLSLPGAAGLTMLLGWLFGFWRGLILVSFASTTGATVAFLLSRYFLRESVQRRFGGRLAAFNRALEREGVFYLFTLRLIVAVPFFVINLLMGLTPMRASTFWWVSQLGMLPGTCVYIYAGSSVPTLAKIAERGTSGILNAQLIIALLLLGIFPIAAKKIMERIRRSPREPGESNGADATG